MSDGSKLMQDSGPTRSALRIRLGAEPLSMVFIDVDDLKALNSKFTNPRVNKGLAELARVLADTARGKGKAYRYSSGDEFALLLPNRTPDESASTAERICRTVRALSIPNEPEMKLTVEAQWELPGGVGAQWDLPGVWRVETRGTPHLGAHSSGC
jgi:diguanylate cyclase (GGDEF)-like protein